MKRAALYVRVSTDHQSVENQVRELKEVAERRGWIVVEVYGDAGVSGAKGRDQRPGLDALLKDASRRKFDVVMAWSIDRLGRRLPALRRAPTVLFCVNHSGGLPMANKEQRSSRETMA